MTVEFNRSLSLEATSLELFLNIEDGVTCPCSSQYAKLYRRKLNSGMARVLIKLAIVQQRFFNESKVWIDISKIRLRSGDYAKLRFWGLIEQKEQRADEVESKEKKTSARWRVTQKGFDFIEGGIEIPKDVLIYNNKSYGFSDEMTTIHKSLTDKFNYGELMEPFHKAVQEGRNNDSKA